MQNWEKYEERKSANEPIHYFIESQDHRKSDITNQVKLHNKSLKCHVISPFRSDIDVSVPR